MKNLRLCGIFVYLIIILLLTACLVCGEDPIVGGTAAAEGELPYQVSLQVAGLFGTLSLLCGGSVISDSWILTAGHCVQNEKVERLEVLAGTIDINQRHPPAQLIQVGAVYLHPHYDALEYENDIALLKLEMPLELNENVQPIGLPSSDYVVPPNISCTISGWGVTRYQKLFHERYLRKAQVGIVPLDICEKDYAGMGKVFLVDERNVCAGVDGGGVDSCQGDSGGPMVCEDQIVGLVSKGYECAKEDYPGIYTSVVYFREWIVNTTAVASI